MERKFEVVITSTDDHTWQGTLRGCGEDYQFQSEIELFLEMAHRIDPAGFGRLVWRGAEGGVE